MSGNFACYPSPSTSLCLDNFRSTSPPSPHFQHKLIVASKYNVAVVVANSRELVAFRSVVDQRIEGTKSRFKVTTLDEEESDIVSIGLNADDSFLGVLVNRQQGCFVLIYAVLALSADISGEAFALSTIRIGNAISKGLAFEWNPTTSDIFAASDDEKTLSVCKLDLDNPTKYGIVGEKKLDANIHEISWSPKGKQLVVGDALGRIYQMKPELELVRMTSPPQMATGVRVVCLCWLSTTEWLVAYSDDQNLCTSTFILSIKKDKPPTWNPINLPLQSSFGVTTKLLVDWNLVLIVTPGSSQLLSLSKHPVTWSVTPLISLPEPAMTDFITGIAVNLSNTEVCTIGDFSTRRLPTVVLLRSNGSLHSFWIAPPSKDYPDCYIPSVPVDISMVRHGIRPSSTGPCDSSTVSVPLTMGLATVTAPSVSTSMALQPTYKTSTTPLFSTMPFGFAKAEQNSLHSGKDSIKTQSPLTISSFGTRTIASTAPVVQKLAAEPPGLSLSLKPSIGTGFHVTGTKQDLPTFALQKEKSLSEMKWNTVDRNEAVESDLSATRTSTEESIKLFLKSWDNYHRNSHSFCINLRNAGNHFDKTVGSLSHVDNAEAIDEVQQMIIELENEMNELTCTLKEKKNLINGNAASRKQCTNTGLFASYPLNYQRTQYENLVQKYEDFVVKLHKAKKIITETKKISVRNQPRRLTDFDPKFDGRLQEGFKNLARFSNVARGRVAELEKTVSYLTSSTESNSTADPLVSKDTKSHTSSVEIPASVFIWKSWNPIQPEPNAPKIELQRKLLIILKQKNDGKNAIKKIEKLRFDCAPSDDTLSSSFLNSSNIEATLTQKISSPIKLKSAVTVQNASTQVDLPFASQPVLSDKTDVLKPSVPLANERETPTTVSTTRQKETETTTTRANVPLWTLGASNDKKEKGVVVTTSASPTTTSTVESTIDHKKSEASVISDSFSAESSKDVITSCLENQEKKVESIDLNVKDVKPSVGFGTAGFSNFLSGEKKDDKPLFSFGSTTNQTPTKSVFGSESPSKPFSMAPKEPSKLVDSKVSQEEKANGEAVTIADPEDTKMNVAKPSDQGEAVTTSDPEDTRMIETKPDQESSTDVVTFSFKPKETSESNQSVLASHSFKFAPKNDTSSDATASVVNSVDIDEGMDDDGATVVPSQKTDSIFGGGFMSGIGSTASANTGRNVFGMKTGSLLKNTSTLGEKSSIFSGGGLKTISTSNTQPSSFASAAQQAVQSDTLSQSTTSSSVFGATPKFGGPPVFGGKPIFGSTAPKPSTTFGGGSGAGGAFSAFSGTKNLFGNVSSTTSSVFGGGMSNQPSSKNTLFGGAQLNKSFSTWR